MRNRELQWHKVIFASCNSLFILCRLIVMVFHKRYITKNRTIVHLFKCVVGYFQFLQSEIGRSYHAAGDFDVMLQGQESFSLFD